MLILPYGLTGLLYAQTNTIYRFYVYDLVIDDAPAIIYASIGQFKIWDQQICLWDHRVRRSEVEGCQKNVPKSDPFLGLSVSTFWKVSDGYFLES